MTTKTAKQITASIDTWLKSQHDSHTEISVIFIDALNHALPKHIGGHGDTRLADRIVSELYGLRLDRLALSCLHFARDYFPVFDVSMKNKTIKLQERNKDFTLDTAIKDYGRLTPAHYERVLTEEEKTKRLETQDKAKKTRESNKKALEDKALQGEREKLRADALALENGKLRETIESNPDRAQAIALAARVTELESILREKQKTIISLQSLRDELTRKQAGVENLLIAERVTTHELRGAIQALENRLSNVA